MTKKGQTSKEEHKRGSVPGSQAEFLQVLRDCAV